MLRVLYVTGHGTMAGIERHVLSLLGNLDRRRFEPGLCVLFEAGPLSGEAVAMGVPTYVLEGRSGHDWRLLGRLRRVLGEFRPDMVHDHEMHLIPAVMMALNVVPWIHTSHCSLRFAPSPRLARFCTMVLGRLPHKIVSVSEATRSDLVDLGLLPAERITTIRNGIDLAKRIRREGKWLRDELGAGNDVVLVGSVGRLAWQKGFGAFIDTAARVARTRPDVQFVLAGDGPLRGQLHRRARQVGLDGRLRFLGHRNDARRIIAGLDLFLLTSVHEELPTTLLEAFAAGTPVAGFLPVGGAAEVVDGANEPPAAALLRRRDPEALADRVIRLLNRPAEAAAMARRARRRVEARFDMARLTRMLEGMYLEVAGGRRCCGTRRS